ncbi:MAG: hypothetical protein A3F83_07370 [Candidatus Glassbacteria bacterium RIFCSPLOWO2_12_FULL_58_11]|uniref:Uncharacterized protein n=1 Tax=Candidatus Glassbacteria bacterium RIFCSPLOWO2_12_FULL_58_11 TaxID=1817867 RepID=A0A1F5YK50_9BACT|nr:MAG: hypothetical protein A3F83_07370 [Candidatus Glassbacteria bacterium RIFCSPLOWO2_12_FULL_58_11]
MNSDLKHLFRKGGSRIIMEKERSKKIRLRVLVPFLVFTACVFSVSSVLRTYQSDPFNSADYPESLRAGADPDSLSSGEDSLAPAIEPYTLDDKVKSGDTFETILQRNGIDREYLYQLLTAAKPSHNLNCVTTGHVFEFSFQDSSLTELRYEIDADRTLIVARVDSAGWASNVEETVYQVREREIGGIINSSLYETLIGLSSNPELALALSEIYAWQIDFHNDIQRGDSFKLIYEEKLHPKGTAKLGKIMAAVFNNGGKTLWAIRFTNPDSSVDYFDLDGKSMRRKFLRSPFKYMPRISSRFNRSRFHPILKIFRPHLGVDYAAPTGTPILALGDGKVIQRGRNGGFGNYIMIKHNGMYSTAYGHLSRYARGLASGGRVTQGQVIGYVGSTGLATGPHLHFCFYKNGVLINPLKVDIPAGEPVNPANMAQFAALRDSMASQLNAIGLSDSRPPVAAAGAASGKGSTLSASRGQ